MIEHTQGSLPAFPCPCDVEGQGMTMREWYAGMALQGLLARPDFNLFPYEGAHLAAELAAQNAFAIADAMLNQAKK